MSEAHDKAFPEVNGVIFVWAHGFEVGMAVPRRWIKARGLN